MTLPLLAAPLGAILAKSSGITLDPIAKPIAAVLAFFYSIIPNFGVAIILLTVTMMIVLTPLTIKQTRSMLVMQKLQPEVKRLQEQHKNDRQALNEAVMALYREHNTSPLGGCLPMLLPLPVFFALFRILEGLSRMTTDPLTHKHVSNPKYLSHGTRMYQDIVHAGGHLNFFGMDLAKSAANIGGTFWDKLPYFILLLVMVGTQYYQQRQLTSRNPQAAQGQQQAIMKVFPLIFGVISIRFPAGVVLYWSTSNLCRIFQQWAMYRWDPKVKALVAQDVKEVEARTREIDQQQRKTTEGRPRLRDLWRDALSGGPAKGTTKPPDRAKPSGTGRPSSTGRAPTSGRPQGRGRPPSAASGKPSSGTGGKPSSGTGGKPPAGSRGTTGRRGTSGKPSGTSPPKPVRPSAVNQGTPNGSRDQDARPDTPPAAVKGADEGADAVPPSASPPAASPPAASPPAASPPAASPPGSVPPQSNAGRPSNGAPGNRTGAGSARNRNRRTRRGR